MTSNIVVVSSAHPHPNLPPVRGKELEFEGVRAARGRVVGWLHALAKKNGKNAYI